MNNTNNHYADVVSYRPRLIASTLEMDTAAAIIASFDAMEEHSDNIQVRMIELIDNLSLSGKKGVMESEGLEKIFSHRMKGIDRGSLVAWIQAFTPIRIKFYPDTGRFEKIVWSASFVKAQKKAGNPVFDMNGLSSVHWAEYAPERTRAVKAGSFERAIKAAVEETAKIGFDKNQSAVEMAQAFMSELQESYEDALNAFLASEKHHKWCDERKEDIMKKAKLAESRGVPTNKLAKAA